MRIFKKFMRSKEKVITMEAKDLITFLKEEKKRLIPNIFVIYMYTPNVYKVRMFLISLIMMVKAFFKRKINFQDIILYLINKNNTFYFKMINFIREEFLKYYCKKTAKKDNCDFIIFKGPVKGDDVIFHVKSIILQDSYHVRDFIKEDSYVIDAGANIGIFSIFASQYAKNGKIYAFEPASETFKILKENTTYYENIEIFKLALGNENKKEKIRVFSISKGISTLVDSSVADQFSQNFGEFVEEEIEVIKLDDFLIQNKIPKIDFIKIDVEGYELKVLEGAKETIKKYSPVIVVSAYHTPSDKIKIPQLVLSLNPNYKYKLNEIGEEDYIFYIDKK
jgi:FkbM family methyltransferase